MSAPARSSIAGQDARVVRRDRDWSRTAFELQLLATSVVAIAFPESRLKRYRQLGRWFSYHGLSRARNGVNCPAGRLVTWIVGLRAIGAPRWTAQLLVDLLQQAVDRLWPAESADPVAALVEEAAAESAADPLEARYLAGDRSVRSELIRCLRVESAQQSAALAVLIAEEGGVMAGGVQ